jgi:hypothetical protein
MGTGVREIQKILSHQFDVNLTNIQNKPKIDY